MLQLVQLMLLSALITAAPLRVFALDYKSFDAVRYADDYIDLKQTFGYNKSLLWNHYLNCGQYENRAAYELSDSYCAEELNTTASFNFEIMLDIVSSIPSGDLSLIGDYYIAPEYIQKLSDRISTVHRQGAALGFIMVDLSTGLGVQYNCDRNFNSASSIKGPYVAAISEFCNAESASLDKMTSTIELSDNEAYCSLYKTYGAKPLQIYFDEACTGKTAYSLPWYTLSPRILAKLWLRMYKYFLQDEKGIEISALYDSPNVSPIHAELGDTCYTISKAGWYGDSKTQAGAGCADGGIIYSPGGVYLIAVMSNFEVYNNSKLQPIIAVLDEIHEASAVN